MTGPREPGTGAPGEVGAGRAHAKAILLGEHTVVHGTPALAVPIPALPVRASAFRAQHRPPGPGQPDAHLSRLTVGAGTPAVCGPQVAVGAALHRWDLDHETVDIVLHRTIPPARGLGSSAADAAAAVRAVADLYGRSLDADTLYELVQCGEQVAHGRASGVDARAILATGPIRFQAGAAEPLAVALDAALVLADSGVPGATQQAVAVAGKTLNGDTIGARRILGRATELAATAMAALSEGRGAALGRTLLAFHELLGALGVGHPRTDALVAAALGAGAHGAKLTGAGLGGCVLALTEPGRAAATVGAALRRAGAVRTWTVPIRRTWS
ncbi:mevalonate kinase [Nocardia farcinica]|uniref:mevalonate kinase n=1 Tax=Nocardia farcinica TaxID=37329 RepID=UPI0018934B22|nr:mevalonate kinase [Nocardia farcinica]MBF6255564.1 mevalonate kinase [Nocardia farcinica]